MPQITNNRRDLSRTGARLLETLEPRNYFSVSTAHITPITAAIVANASLANGQGPNNQTAGNKAASGPSVEIASQRPFDTTLYSNKPADTGMDDSLLLPSGNFAFWLVNKKLAGLGTVEEMWTNPEKLAMVAKAAWRAGYTKFCMDDEDGDYQRILSNIGVIRAAVPQMKVGVFCFPQTYYNWDPDFMHSVNELAEIKAIMDASDFSVPGIDMRWDLGTAKGRESWSDFLKLAVTESERVMPGKPCYPFLTFEYNPMFKKGDASDADFAWQLEQVAALNCTPIVWGGWRREWKNSLCDQMAAGDQFAMKTTAARVVMVQPSARHGSGLQGLAGAGVSGVTAGAAVLPSVITSPAAGGETTTGGSTLSGEKGVAAASGTSVASAATGVSPDTGTKPAKSTASAARRRAPLQWMLSPALARPTYHRVKPSLS